MNTKKHWSAYKKYQTSMSFCGMSIAANDGLGTVGHVCAICPECGPILEHNGFVDGEMIDAMTEHYHQHQS